MLCNRTCPSSDCGILCNHSVPSCPPFHSSVANIHFTKENNLKSNIFEHKNNSPTLRSSSVACNTCLKIIRNDSFHCTKCFDFDVCRDCYAKQAFLHPCPKPHFVLVRSSIPSVASLTCSVNSMSVSPQSNFMYAICDHCEQPIHNVRYKCSVCDDYDICESCLTDNSHSNTHAFVRITKAYPHGLPSFHLFPQFLSAELFESASTVHRSVQCDNCLAHPIVGPRFHCLVCEDYDLCSSCVSHVHHDHHSMLRLTREIPASPLHLSKPEKPKVLNFDFKLVEDSILPLELSPGCPFYKIWHIRNTSCQSWPSPLYVKFNGGDKLFPGDNPYSFPITSSVHPGEDVNFTVALKVPEKSNKEIFTAFFNICSDDGSVFHKSLCAFLRVPKSFSRISKSSF